MQLVDVLHIAQFVMQITHEVPSQNVPVAQQAPMHGPQTYKPVIPYEVVAGVLPTGHVDRQ
jgi:hypothetical protein